MSVEDSSKVRPEGDDAIHRATLARGIQGYHEAEFSFYGEADLHKSFIDCDKNPGHKKFVPVSKFSANDLPEPYSGDPDILKFIQTQADLTVRVSTSYTSPDRPDGYAFHKYGGQDMQRVGTGFLQYVYLSEGRTTDPCPCPECVNSPNPKMVYANAKIRTATHVVFDKAEAYKTVVELFFDDNKDKSKVKYMYGKTVRFGAIQGDWCDMRCVTHDMELYEQIKATWGRWRWLETKVNQKYQDKLDTHKLAILVSHPHGCNKQVSVGSWQDRSVVDRCPGWENCVYTYTSPSCPGSSGAPVWILGRMRWGGFFGRHPHSGRPLTGDLNLSAVGWDRVGQ